MTEHQPSRALGSQLPTPGGSMPTLLPYNSAGCFAPYEGHQVVEETAGKDTEVIALGGPAHHVCRTRETHACMDPWFRIHSMQR